MKFAVSLGNHLLYQWQTKTKTSFTIGSQGSSRLQVIDLL